MTKRTKEMAGISDNPFPRLTKLWVLYDILLDGRAHSLYRLTNDTYTRLEGSLRVLGLSEKEWTKCSRRIASALRTIRQRVKPFGTLTFDKKADFYRLAPKD